MNELLRSATNDTLKRSYAKSLALLKQNDRSLDALAEALFAAGYRQPARPSGGRPRSRNGLSLP